MTTPAETVTERKRLMVITAHPDDAEFNAGGLMLKWASAEQDVLILCLTDGSAGHHKLAIEDLAGIRQEEARNAADLLGAKVVIWDVRDGELEASISLRKQLIGDIRAFKPDLILTHRTADYHPDHRACAQLVMDACYMLQVPNIAPAYPALQSIPPVLLFADRFQYPRAFQPDWLCDTSDVISGVIELLHCHVSQVYEWLPYTQGIEVPEHNRRQWLRQWYSRRPRSIARRFAHSGVEAAEAFELSEYGGAFEPERFDFISLQKPASQSTEQSSEDSLKNKP
ncbi:MAG: PIG-L family deacetylase [Pseudomonadaceae bacterium]|nr:PIG-L family deacetylase [Pseudomonadaceae bacterium]